MKQGYALVKLHPKELQEIGMVDCFPLPRVGLYMIMKMYQHLHYHNQEDLCKWTYL